MYKYLFNNLWNMKSVKKFYRLKMNVSLWNCKGSTFKAKSNIFSSPTIPFSELMPLWWKDISKQRGGDVSGGITYTDGKRKKYKKEPMKIQIYSFCKHIWWGLALDKIQETNFWADWRLKVHQKMKERKKEEVTSPEIGPSRRARFVSVILCNTL